MQSLISPPPTPINTSALNKSNADTNELLKLWLKSIDLSYLFDVLVKEGYDSLHRVKLVTLEDLKELGVKRGHAQQLVSTIINLNSTSSIVLDNVVSPTVLDNVVVTIPSIPTAVVDEVLVSNADGFIKPAYAVVGFEDAEVESIVKSLKVSLEEHGCRGIVSLGRKFRIIDDDGSNQLDYDEFRKCLAEHAFDLSDNQLRKVFRYFDQDNSGTISYEEFLVGIRGQLNARRRDLVLMAFDCLDLDKSGIITLDEIVKCYIAAEHPDVKSGKRSKGDVFREFLDTFDGGEKDGQVTPTEFCRYYSNVSASIDDDDYFELMIRNAWHISGGKGAYENTTCRRVLATHADGRQTVEEITNDLFMDKGDIQGMLKNLHDQGKTDIAEISLSGMDSETPPEEAVVVTENTTARYTPSAHHSKSSIVLG